MAEPNTHRFLDGENVCLDGSVIEGRNLKIYGDNNTIRSSHGSKIHGNDNIIEGSEIKVLETTTRSRATIAMSLETTITSKDTVRTSAETTTR